MHQQKMQLEMNEELDSVGELVAWLESDLVQWNADIHSLKRAGESMESEVRKLQNRLQIFSRVCGTNPAEFINLKRNELAKVYVGKESSVCSALFAIYT